jgi:hypothetical protein
MPHASTRTGGSAPPPSSSNPRMLHIIRAAETAARRNANTATDLENAKLVADGSGNCALTAH